MRVEPDLASGGIVAPSGASIKSRIDADNGASFGAERRTRSRERRESESPSPEEDEVAAANHPPTWGILFGGSGQGNIVGERQKICEFILILNLFILSLNAILNKSLQ
jgi:hypothetical protein